MNQVYRELKIAYISEIEYLLQKSIACIAQIETARDFSSDAITELFRSMHTIKGSSSMMDLSQIVEVAHLTEDVCFFIHKHGLDILDDEQRHVLLRVLSRSIRLLKEGLLQFSTDDVIKIDTANFKKEISDFLQNTPSESSTSNISKRKSIPLAILNASNSVQVLLTEDCEMKHLRCLLFVKLLQDQGLQFSYFPDQIETDSHTADYIAQFGFFLSFFTVEDAMKAMDLLSNMSNISSYHLLQADQKNLALQQQQISKPLPLSSMYPKMESVVQHMNLALHKQVTLIIEDQPIKIKSFAFNSISDAIMHIIRNSMDHGIESTQSERIALGKEGTGSITLSISFSEYGLRINIIDDGAGINTEKLLERAATKNLLTKPKEEYSIDECYDLLTLPGFSTKNDATEFSGRGLGLNIARRNIDSLGGSFHVESIENKGTTISLILPPSLTR